MSITRKLDYTDPSGISRRVLIPADANGIDPNEGIPVSLNLDELYSHMPPDFLKALYQALWAVGLIEPQDFLAGGAADKYRAALLSVIKKDYMNVMTIAKQQNAHE